MTLLLGKRQYFHQISSNSYLRNCLLSFGTDIQLASVVLTTKVNQTSYDELKIRKHSIDKIVMLIKPRFTSLIHRRRCPMLVPVAPFE